LAQLLYLLLLIEIIKNIIERLIMLAICLNNKEYQRAIVEKYYDVQPFYELDVLKSYLKKNPETTLILDSELKTTDSSKFQDLEGLKLAYEFRTDPDLQFRGFIKLFGFLPEEKLQRNNYKGILFNKNSERLPSSDGSKYYRYPDEIDLKPESALSKDKWYAITSEMNQIFKQKISDFHHVFKNVTLLNIDDPDGKKEKERDLKILLANFKRINELTIINARFKERYNFILNEFSHFLDNFHSKDKENLLEKFLKLQDVISTFNESLK
jgi:hypothetical protein